MTLGQDMRILDLMAHLKETYPGLHLAEGQILVMVNNNLATIDHVLSPNDIIAFLPPIGGG